MKIAPALLLFLSATPAAAQDLREFCGDRPGLGTPACTVDKGHLQVELGLADWTLDRQPDARSDTLLAGDVAVRYGFSDTLEGRIGWSGIGHVRERDVATGAVSRASRAGDVTIGLKQNLMHPDGSALSLALLAFATLPVGRRPVGAGTWSAGLLLPMTFDLSDAVQIEFTPEIDAAPDEDGAGRHLAYSGVVGVIDTIGKTVSAALEYQWQHDRDPASHETQQLAGLSIAWLAQPQLQLDVGANAGLNHAAPDVELYVGISRKF